MISYMMMISRICINKKNVYVKVKSLTDVQGKKSRLRNMRTSDFSHLQKRQTPLCKKYI